MQRHRPIPENAQYLSGFQIEVEQNSKTPFVTGQAMGWLHQPANKYSQFDNKIK